MKVFASGTDKDDIIARAKDSTYNAALIYNKKGEIFGHIADMERGLYLSDVPVFIQYPEGLDERRLQSVKECETFSEVLKITKVSDWTFYKALYPLTEEEKFKYKEIIRTRFRYKSIGHNIKPGFPSKSYTAPPVKSTNRSTGIDPDRLFSDDEFAIIEQARTKPFSAMTDSEWELVNAYNEFYGINSLYNA